MPELVVNATEQQPSQARPSVFAAWDAAAEKLQLLHRRTGTFCTPLKSKRVVRLSTEQGSSPWEELVGRPDRLAPGVSIKLKEGPCKGRLFTRVAPDGDSAWVSTTDRAETVTAQGAEASSDVRGQVEEWHRGLKHLTGSEQCPCRGARAQRHHLACCSQAWGSLKVKAKELGQTRYELRSSLFSAYLRVALRHPRIAAC